MDVVNGGSNCACSCYYEGQKGGSSTEDNYGANYDGGIPYSKKGNTQMFDWNDTVCLREVVITPSN